MKVTVEELAPCKKRLIVEIPQGEVEERFNEIYRELRESAQLPGFRPGRAPLSLLKLRFRDYVRGEVLEKILPEASKKAIEDAGIAPVGEPEVPELNLEEGEPFKFVMVVEAEPEFELGEYRGLQIEQREYKVPKDDVESALEKLKMQRAKLKDKEGGEAKEGDVVVLDYEAFVEGKPLEEGKFEGMTVLLGEGKTIPGFEEGIIGHKVGEAFDIEVEFPEDYHDERLAGKRVIFGINLKEVKARELPLLNDEFAREMGDESLEDLRSRVERNLQEEYNKKARAEMINQIKEKLVAQHDFPLPPSLVELELKRRLEDSKFQLRLRGVNPEEAEIDWGKTERELEEEVLKDLRFSFILSKIARLEGIEVSEGELRGEVEAVAQRLQRPLEEVVDVMKRSGRLKSFSLDMLNTKVLDFLLEEAKLIQPPEPLGGVVDEGSR